MCSSRKDGERGEVVVTVGDSVTEKGHRFWLFGRAPDPEGVAFEVWASRLPQPAGRGGSGEGWNALLDAAELAAAVELGLVEPSLAAEPPA